MQPASPFHLFGLQAYTVLSNSMQPDFQTGDIVIIRKTDPEDIRVDDVITFRQSENRYITHRVHSIGRNDGNVTFQTKGDANNTMDEEYVPASTVNGKKLFHIPYAGYAARFMMSPMGITIFIFLPLILYGAISIYQRIMYRRNENAAKIKGRNYS